VIRGSYKRRMLTVDLFGKEQAQTHVMLPDGSKLQHPADLDLAQFSCSDYDPAPLPAMPAQPGYPTQAPWH
jgi:hypothetical protein